MHEMTTNPRRVSTNDQSARMELAAAHRLAVIDDFHEGSWNHLSLAHPDRPESFLLTPPATHWSQVHASNLIELGPGDQKRLEEAGGLAWVAYRIHAPIHAARPDAACVLHVHTPHATALTMLADSRLILAEQNALDFVGRIAYTDEYDGAGSTAIDHGREIAEALGSEHSILFLKNHGIVVTGASVAEAYTDLYTLERACRVLILAMSTGRPLAIVADEVAQKSAADNADNDFKHGHFAAMLKVLDEVDPSYRA
jgi:ribulose-5-phosphate 4-epimerase/fuculose-1-phosphate aldolase